MSRVVQRLYFKKETYKFSAAHMTVFKDGTKERLHGHNFTTDIAIDLQTDPAEDLIPFSFFKDGIREICANWDEKFLLAIRSPHLKILSKSKTEVEFTLCNKRYLFPAEDVSLLDIRNITTEELSREFCSQLLKRLYPNGAPSYFLGITVRIDESPGQGASTHWPSESKEKSA